MNNDYSKVRQAKSDQAEEENAEYQAFVEKFKPKKTTDDCYTPPAVYDAVAQWVEKEYSVSRERFVRPFYPGGDYENFDYLPEQIVVDNPPFSILSQIVRFYCDKGIKFFLFCPALTPFVAPEKKVSYILEGVTIEYENGAKVNTSFVTNLDTKRIRSAPMLYQAVQAAVDALRKEKRAELPKYTYPDEVLTASAINQLSKYGVEFSLTDGECHFIRSLAMQRKEKKNIFGRGWLISEKAAAEKAAAEKTAATKWLLDEDEKAIVKRLGA